MSQDETGGPREELRRRVLWALLKHAFFRWESAVVIALTMLLMYFVPYLPLPFWQPWLWLVGGLAAGGAITLATLTNAKINAQVVGQLLRAKFDVQRLRTPALQSRVEQALEYRRRIESAITAQGEGVLREHLREVSADIDTWITNIYSLALRLDTYEHDDIVRQDLAAAPRALQDLQARLRQEDDPQVRAQIEETVKGKQAQITSLQTLQSTMERAAYQLEHTLAALGTVYSQLLLIGVKDIDSGRGQRLRQDIAQQVASLQDIASSLDEVYQYSGPDDQALAAARQRLGTPADQGGAQPGAQTSQSRPSRNK